MSSTTPDLVAPIEAWRAWMVAATAGEPRLRSVVHRHAWEPMRPFAATCATSLQAAWTVAHTAPSRHCACGVHAARDRDEAMSWLAPPSRRHGIVAIGRVALWGSVVEGDRGWRASFAYPITLELTTWRTDPYAAGDLQWVAQLIEEAYCVPVVATRRSTPDGRAARTTAGHS